MRCWWRGVHCWLEVTAGMELDQSLWSQLQQFSHSSRVSVQRNTKTALMESGKKTKLLEKSWLNKRKLRVNNCRCVWSSSTVSCTANLIFDIDHIQRVEVWHASLNGHDLNSNVHLHQHLQLLLFTVAATVRLFDENCFWARACWCNKSRGESFRLCRLECRPPYWFYGLLTPQSYLVLNALLGIIFSSHQKKDAQEVMRCTQVHLRFYNFTIETQKL